MCDLWRSLRAWMSNELTLKCFKFDTPQHVCRLSIYEPTASQLNCLYLSRFVYLPYSHFEKLNTVDCYSIEKSIAIIRSNVSKNRMSNERKMRIDLFFSHTKSHWFTEDCVNSKQPNSLPHNLLILHLIGHKTLSTQTIDCVLDGPHERKKYTTYLNASMRVDNRCTSLFLKRVRYCCWPLFGLRKIWIFVYT